MGTSDSIISSSESNFINFFNTIKDLIFILDMNGHILYANRTAEERLGYHLDELIGQSVLFVHPEARREEAFQNVMEMLDNRREYCPIPLITKEGFEFPVETRVCLGTWDGKQVLFGVSKDISELKLSEEKFEKAFQTNGSLMAISDMETGRYIDVNQTFSEVLGYHRDEVIGRTSKELGLFFDFEERRNALHMLGEHGKVRNMEVNVRDRHGDPHYGIFHVDEIYIGSQKCLITTMQDITELKRLETEIKEVNTELQRMVEDKVAEARLIDLELKNQVYLTELLFNQPMLGIFYMMLDEPIVWNDEIDKKQVMDYVLDHHRITKVNQAMLNQYRAKESDFVGLTVRQLYAHDIEKGKEVWTRFLDEGHLYINTEERRMDGTPMYVVGDYICMYDKEGRIQGHFGIQTDVTEKVEADRALREAKVIYEEKIDQLSQYDTLTGLLNRDALRKLIAQEQGTEIDPGSATFICIDIDNFRIVNESLGPQAGDILLQDLAVRFQNVLGDQGDIYRKDGDEFVIVLEGAAISQAHRISKELLESVSRELKIQMRRYYLTASIGMAAGRQDSNLEQVLENADTALYVAKKSKNTIVLFDPSMERMRTREAILEEDLDRALDREEFEVYYQPIITMADGSVEQAEALLRWNHPEFGQISPTEFIPLAEKSRLIIPLTNWVIQDCARRLASWQKDGIHTLLVSINLSLVCFENRIRDLMNFLNDTVRDAGISPANLKLEITETNLMYNPEEIIQVFDELKEDGFRLALDDFGTGYSSIGYMKDMPIDILKLDRSLISMLESDERQRMITQSLIMIAHNLGMEVVAEGVETKDQMETLKHYGCDFMQGFLFGRPMPANQFLTFVKNRPEEQQITWETDACMIHSVCL